MTYDESDVDKLLRLLERESPDPVDVFEDRLARRLGVVRGPGVTDAEWRRQRAAIIDKLTEEGDA